MMYIHLILINPIDQQMLPTFMADGSGNATHKPEESFSYEFGVKSYVNENTFFRGTAFKTRLKNLIEADINSQIHIYLMQK